MCCTSCSGEGEYKDRRQSRHKGRLKRKDMGSQHDKNGFCWVMRTDKRLVAYLHCLGLV